MSAIYLSLILFFAPTRALAPGPSLPENACKAALPSLQALLRAFDQRERAQERQRQLARLARRARRSAWLPQLLLSAELRHLRDRERRVEVAAPLRLDARYGDTQVIRAQMRWQLDRLLFHHGTLAALRFARSLADTHHGRRQRVAKQHAQLFLLWQQGCTSAWPLALYEEYLLVRAELVAATALALPLPPALGVNLPRAAPAGP